jgi:rhamnogalacturonan endolyase
MMRLVIVAALAQLGPAPAHTPLQPKATPVLSADMFGDWREEVIWRTTDDRELRIYTTTIETPHRMPTLMHDPQYRLAIAGQNVAYNQPPHPSFYLGDEAPLPPRPRIVTLRRK